MVCTCLELYFKNTCVHDFIQCLIYINTYLLPLEKTEGAIRNGQFRDTDNIRNTRNRTNNDRHYITQKKNYNPDDNSSDTKE